MAKEYIERDFLIKRLEVSPLFSNFATGGIFIKAGVIDLIEKQTAADVEEVVRCKDCVNWGGVTHGFVCRKFSGIETRICMGADQFCSYGERKTE